LKEEHDSSKMVVAGKPFIFWFLDFFHPQLLLLFSLFFLPYQELRPNCVREYIAKPFLFLNV
jgi:hypothetical protein